MSAFYDTLGNPPPEEREAALLAALPGQIAHAQKRSPGVCQTSWPGWMPASITSRAALAQLPVTRKYELLERQQAQRSTNALWRL